MRWYFSTKRLPFLFTRCIPVCSVTGSSVVDFNGKVHSIPDRCVYSLVKPQGSSCFEVLAGFRERRLLNVPFLDYLKLSLQNVTISLEQGGRVQVRKKTLLEGLLVMGRSFAEATMSKLLHFVTAGSPFCVHVGQRQHNQPEQCVSGV